MGLRQSTPRALILPDRVRDTIIRHGMFAPGQKAGVAVSGGADSVCLLHVLHQLAPHWNLHLSVIHIDHGIRGALAEADADFVRSLAASFALPFHFRRANVPAIDDNLEQAARRVRLEFFAELLSAGTVDRIATGHTRSDQAETVLYRILRGTGLQGLSGIRPVTRDHIVRPLLYCTREEVRTWLEERRIEWREDETNRDRARARNRIRHDLLPQLRREFNPQLDEALANIAELAREEEETRTPADLRGSGDVCYLQIQTVTRRVVRQAIETVKGDLRQIGFRHIETVLEMAQSNDGHGRAQLPGVDVFRSFEWIRLAPAGYRNTHRKDFAVPVRPPETVNVPGSPAAIDFQLVDREGTSASPSTYDNVIDDLDWERITLIPALAGAGFGLLELRNWRPGDRYRRVGRTYEEKIKLLFHEARVPLWERRGWPVLTANNQIVWCRSFGPGADFAPDRSTRTILRILDSNRTGS